MLIFIFFFKKKYSKNLSEISLLFLTRLAAHKHRRSYGRPRQNYCGNRGLEQLCFGQEIDRLIKALLYLIDGVYIAVECPGNLMNPWQ